MSDMQKKWDKYLEDCERGANYRTGINPNQLRLTPGMIRVMPGTPGKLTAYKVECVARWDYLATGVVIGFGVGSLLSWVLGV